MKRSTGVTVSAILVFLGSGLTLMFGALMAFAVFFMPKIPTQPPFLRYIFGSSLFLYTAFGIWGIASGVGLLRLRQWARISMLVFSGILLVFTLPVLLIVPFMPMPQTPGSPESIGLVVKIGMSMFYGIIAVIGGVWLYFFNRGTVKEQFRSPADAISSPSVSSRRPLSISIIGWILLVTGCLALPTLFFRSPMLFMGFLLTGWRTTLFMLTWCVVQGAAGVGLLRLRSWGRTLSIYLFSFGLLNGAVSVLLPGRATRFDKVYAAIQANMQAKMGLPMTGMPNAGMPTTFSPEIMHFFMWMGLIFGVGFAGLQLWFVVTRKEAFSTPTDVPVPSP